MRQLVSFGLGCFVGYGLGGLVYKLVLDTLSKDIIVYKEEKIIGYTDSYYSRQLKKILKSHPELSVIRTIPISKYPLEAFTNELWIVPAELQNTCEKPNFIEYSEQNDDYFIRHLSKIESGKNK